MPTLEDNLRQALRGVEEQRHKAESDLFGVVKELADTVERITRGKFKLVLVTLNERPEALDYQLSLVDGETQYEVMAIRVPMSGYPLLLGDSSLIGAGIGVPVHSKEELQLQVNNLTKEPNSRLVLRLAFLLRKAEVEVATGAGS